MVQRVSGGEPTSPHFVNVYGEVEVIRIQEDIQYARNRAALGARTLALIDHCSEIYRLLITSVLEQLPEPLAHAYLFAVQMCMECDATLIRSMLLLIRGHVFDAHAQTRRAIGAGSAVDASSIGEIGWSATRRFEMPILWLLGLDSNRPAAE